MIEYRSLSYQFNDILQCGCINCNKYILLTRRLYQDNNIVSYKCKNCDISIGIWHEKEKFCFITKGNILINFSYTSKINICDMYWSNCLKSIKCSSNQEMISNFKNISNLFSIYKKLIILK